MTGARVGVGVIGAGMISGYYLDNLTQFQDLNVIAIADLDRNRARARRACLRLSDACTSFPSLDGRQL